VTVLRKHVNNTDVAIEILKSFYVREKGLYKLKVRWWNIGRCHPPWSLGIVEKIEIPKHQMREWHAYAHLGVEP
jgi:hypothetical protein